MRDLLGGVAYLLRWRNGWHDASWQEGKCLQMPLVNGAAMAALFLLQINKYINSRCDGLYWGGSRLLNNYILQPNIWGLTQRRPALGRALLNFPPTSATLVLPSTRGQCWEALALGSAGHRRRSSAGAALERR